MKSAKTLPVEKLSSAKLAAMLKNYRRHSDEDLKAAYAELESRGELGEVIDRLRGEVRDGRLVVGSVQSDTEIFRDFNPNRMKAFRTGSTQQMVFEQKLILEDIPYYRQEALDVIVPLVYYYFADRDFARADQIEIETENYVGNLPVEKRNHGAKRAGSAALWIIAFFAIFLLFSLLMQWLRGI